MAVEPNHVYVIPLNTAMTIAQGVLRLTLRDQTRIMSKAVDTFFYSLAEDRGNKAIGVVLSGGNTDGSLGLEAIKAAGGITFAQTIDSAQVAIATGQVDFILPPDGIATQLVQISRHPYFTMPPMCQVPIDEQSPNQEDALVTIFNLLHASFGVNFTNYKHTTIKRRIFRRMALYHQENLADYVRCLQENYVEVQLLYQEILIHVTSFFRDPEIFEILKQEVFPALMRERPAESVIRIWVAGCSTGEEAYSMAITLLEFFDNQPRHPSIQIFATDISEIAIQKARSGIYLPSQMANISSAQLQRFFVQTEAGYQIKKTVRELCVFARQNMLEDPPFSRLDLISCRNVLIYFGALLQKKVLPMFHYGLKPNGFLILGSSETVGEFSNLFVRINQKCKIYAKKTTLEMIKIDLGKRYFVEATPTQLTTKELHLKNMSLSEVADRVILTHYTPVGVIVNNQLDILEFRGQTGIYLEPSPGQASLNLLSMVKTELRLELRTAIHEAKKERKMIKKEGIILNEGEYSRMVRLDVVPLPSNASSDEDYLLILFNEISTLSSINLDLETSPSPQKRSIRTRKQKSHEQAEIERLQKELETSKAYLRSIIEEQQAANEDLRAANEEILSSNEELQSTNEELQTAKEEIQATNEELCTINEELFQRNLETTQVSDDFQNLLASINIPILILEGDLRIRRFTPTAVSVFNLIPTDIGRPLSDIKHNLNIDHLESQILEVIDTLTIKTQQVQDREGNWYDLRIRPYRTIDNRIDGAVIVLLEIDPLKRTME